MKLLKIHKLISDNKFNDIQTKWQLDRNKLCRQLKFFVACATNPNNAHRIVNRRLLYLQSSSENSTPAALVQAIYVCQVHLSFQKLNVHFSLSMRLHWCMMCCRDGAFTTCSASLVEIFWCIFFIHQWNSVIKSLDKRSTVCFDWMRNYEVHNIARNTHNVRYFFRVNLWELVFPSRRRE